MKTIFAKNVKIIAFNVMIALIVNDANLYIG